MAGGMVEQLVVWKGDRKAVLMVVKKAAEKVDWTAGMMDALLVEHSDAHSANARVDTMVAS